MVQAVTDWNDFHTYIPKQTIPILKIFADIIQGQTNQYIAWRTGDRKQLGVDKIVAAFTQMKTANQLALYITTRQQCEARGQPVSMYRYQHVPQPTPTFGGAPSPIHSRPIPQAGPSGWSHAPVPSRGPTLADWKPSPMWKPIAAISNMEPLPEFSLSENSHVRKERKVPFTLSADACEKMLQSKANPSATPSYSVRLFCSSSDYFRPPNERVTPANAAVTNRSIPIEYPTAPDVRVDDLAIPFKERGLRGKAGSAPPFDLNKSSRGLTLVPARLGSVAFGHTGATTGKTKNIIKKFYFQIVLVEWTSKEVLQKKLAEMAPRPVDQCLTKSRDDDDIEVGSSRMSLKDPLSCMRISQPVRSAKCSHQQCFDATWWIESNAVHPQWLCPFCNRELNFADLIVDGYFLSILKAVPESIEEVILEPDGEWHSEDDRYGSAAWIAAHPPLPTADTKPLLPTHRHSSSPSPGLDKGKRKAIEVLSSDDEDAPSRPSNAPSLRPSAQSRQTSTGRSPSVAANGVIDLTLDSDDEGLPVPIRRPDSARNPPPKITPPQSDARSGWERNGDTARGFPGDGAVLQSAQDGPSMGSYREMDLFDEDWDDGVGTGMGSAYQAHNGSGAFRNRHLSPSPDADDSRPNTPPLPPHDSIMSGRPDPAVRIAPTNGTAGSSATRAFPLTAVNSHRPGAFSSAPPRPGGTIPAIPKVLNTGAVVPLGSNHWRPPVVNPGPLSQAGVLEQALGRD